MRSLDYVPASAAEVGYGKLAADLTVRDVLALAEVASWSEPGARRQAARLALTEARRNSADTLDPDYSRPRTWSAGHRQAPDAVDYVVDFPVKSFCSTGSGFQDEISWAQVQLLRQ